jgi:C4-dicarboxylate transporter DctM subunit
MSPELVGIIGIVVLLALMAAGMWIGLAMAVVGLLGIAYIQGFDQAFMVTGRMPYQMVSNYQFAVMPMFILMGMVVSETGIGADLYYAAHKWMGQLQGGLASATVGACALFAAITGSSTSGVVVMAKVALPEMRKHKYDERLSAGTIAAGSTIGILIPPSIGFILYGILTEQSVGKLFMAGIIPGVLEAVFYIATIYLLCRFNPRMGPPGPRASFREKIVSLKNIWAMVALFLLVMGGIYGGVFTPTEAGAAGAFGAIIITIVMRRFNRKGFLKTLLETGLMTVMILLIMAGVSIFTKFMAASELPFMLGNIVAGLDVPDIVIIVAIVLMYIILGCFLPAIMAIILTIPVIYPVVLAMGFDPIWFGVILVRMVEIGSITPPVGMNAFILSGVSGVPLGTIFRGVIPFVVADFAHLALLIAVPALSLFLPSMM